MAEGICKFISWPFKYRLGRLQRELEKIEALAGLYHGENGWMVRKSFENKVRSLRKKIFWQKFIVSQIENAFARVFSR